MTGRIVLLVFVLAGQARNPVVLTEDFESFQKSNWHDFGATPDALEIVEGGRAGKCAQITATLGKNTGAHLYKMLDPGLDECHLRFYVKFEKNSGYIHHFVHLVGYNPGTKWPQGGAGERPDGDKRFSTGIEPWGSWGKYAAPGAWNLYTYWCEMKQSPDGKYWGNSFAPGKPALVVTDRWTCIEVQLKCNTPGQADGEQAFWIDGKEAGRWKGIRWRTDGKLKVNGVLIMLYVTENAARQNRVTPPDKVRVWFDDIVVSTKYIGPVAE